ncbi:MAG: pyridoxamine 5'-phosphate oxidase family protein [bacterium]
MKTTELEEKAIAAFAGTKTPKFLATASAAGVPNIVPIISIEAWDPQTLIFGEFMIWKTKKNLEENAKVGVSVMTENLNCWTVRGTFLGYERTGERYDKISLNEMYRYNAYSGLRNCGIIRVDDVKRVKGMLAAPRLVEMGFASLASTFARKEGAPMPPQVSEKFARAKAAKFISYIDADGYPVALPVPSMFSVGGGALEMGAGSLKGLDGNMPQSPFRAAATIITFDPVAYQVKGTVNDFENRLGTRIARLEIDEVYSASPPLPGKRIDRK